MYVLHKINIVIIIIYIATLYCMQRSTCLTKPWELVIFDGFRWHRNHSEQFVHSIIRFCFCRHVQYMRIYSTIVISGFLAFTLRAGSIAICLMSKFELIRLNSIAEQTVVGPLLLLDMICIFVGYVYLLDMYICWICYWIFPLYNISRQVCVLMKSLIPIAYCHKCGWCNSMLKQLSSDFVKDLDELLLLMDLKSACIL